MDSKKRKVDEDGGATATVDQIKTWLGGMSREESVEFIAQLAVQYAPVYDAIQQKIQGDPTFTKLFVRSLDWSTTDASLHDLFIQYGPIQEAVVLKDKMTGKSKGFGFVTFETPSDALKALEESSKSLDGREISVHLAAEKNTRPAPAARGGYGSSAPNISGWTSSPAGAGAAADRRLFVRGLAWETTTESLRATFEQYGPILEAAVITDQSTGKSKGFGFVTFQTAEGARAALTQPDKQLDGRLTSCNYAVERSKNFPSQTQPKLTTPQAPFGVGAGGADPIQHQLQELQQQQLQLQQRIVSQQQQQLQQQQHQMQQQQYPPVGFQAGMQQGMPQQGMSQGMPQGMQQGMMQGGPPTHQPLGGTQY